MKAELLLESHSDPQEPTIVADRTEEMLKGTSGKVLLALEDAYIPEAESDQVSELIEHNFPPSLAYVLGCNARAFVDGIKILDPSVFSDTDILTPETFENTPLFPFDGLHRYRDRNGEPRLKIILEGTNAETEAVRYPAEEYYETRGNLVLELGNGLVAEPLAEYKKHIMRWARYLSTREELFTEKIMRNMDGVEGLVINFGANHSRIQHLLHARGVKVRKFFIEGGIHASNLFSPEAAAIRKIMAKGEGSLSDIEWKRSLYGEVIGDLLKQVRNVDRTSFLQGYSNQDIQMRVLQGLRTLKTQEGIERFEDRLVHNGLLESIVSLFDQ